MNTRQARKYELRERARRQEDTRRRIVEATEKLHATVGPARTTVVDIARLAGVSRPTVYSHFPDERSLFEACGGDWYAANPRPSPETWASIAEPEERLRGALGELYEFYAAREPMLTNIARDIALMPVLREVATALQQPWTAEAIAVLASGWGAGQRRVRLVRAAIAHALDFRTWRTLVREQELSQDEAVELMAHLVSATRRAQARVTCS